MSMVSILRTIVFCWISYWNIALNSLRNVGRDMGSSTLGEARVDSVPRRAYKFCVGIEGLPGVAEGGPLRDFV